jgi:hypothetical protein
MPRQACSPHSHRNGTGAANDVCRARSAILTFESRTAARNASISTPRRNSRPFSASARACPRRTADDKTSALETA